jgi:CheY-like chemotaxis protein
MTAPIVMISSNTNALKDGPTLDTVAALLQRPVTRNTLISTLTALGAQVEPVPEARTVPPPTLPDAAVPPSTAADAPGSTDSAAMPMFRARPRGVPPPEPAPKALPDTERTQPKPPETADAPGPSASPHATAAATAPDETPPATPAQRRMRVLAAEDNKTNQLVFRKMVKHLDIDLTFANDGMEAVEAHASIEPDLIFMDISMPRMDGKTATLTIREAEKATGAHVPIVALTAHAMRGDDASIIEAGLDHYLTKPLRKPAIQEMIQRHAPPDAIPPLPDEDEQEEAKAGAA